jgi:hypothetical protein
MSLERLHEILKDNAGGSGAASSGHAPVHALVQMTPDLECIRACVRLNLARLWSVARIPLPNLGGLWLRTSRIPEPREIAHAVCVL